MEQLQESEPFHCPPPGPGQRPKRLACLPRSGPPEPPRRYALGGLKGGLLIQRGARRPKPDCRDDAAHLLTEVPM